MGHVAVIGCGVVGAAIAYELSQQSGLTVTVLDRQPPAQAATGAALGVLMGIISQKVKGNAWNLRQESIRRYETLVPELEAITGKTILFNRQGILLLCFAGEDQDHWRELAAVRQTQSWHLEIWERSLLQTRCPQIVSDRVTGAIYSPQDRQVDPTALTLALVEAAKRNGVTFHFDSEAKFAPESYPSGLRRCQVQTAAGSLEVDWVVIAAGLGTTTLTRSAAQPLEVRPVLGQAMQIRLDQPLGYLEFQPVITGEDIHIVPLGGGEYWVGATVEFPPDGWEAAADPALLEEVWQGAIAFCPALAPAKILKTWSGLRPRPFNRPAPVIELLAGYSNVVLATGHYRNGVLLAPATAKRVRQIILQTS